MDFYSKFSTPDMMELKDVQAVRLLLIYLLKQLNKPITPEQLYEVAVGNEIVNYFSFTEAIESLLESGTIYKETLEDTKEYYFISDFGKAGADEFKEYVPKSFRDKILTSALNLFARIKLENEVKCEITNTENGYYVRCKFLSVADNLMDLKLFAPDIEQAKLIRAKIMNDPTAFYTKILAFALNEE